MLENFARTSLRQKEPVALPYAFLNPARSTQFRSVEFIVVKENLTPLLGAKVIQQMKLIEVYKENFEKVAAATTTSATSKKAQTAQEIIEEFSV